MHDCGSFDSVLIPIAELRLLHEQALSDLMHAALEPIAGEALGIWDNVNGALLATSPATSRLMDALRQFWDALLLANRRQRVTWRKHCDDQDVVVVELLSDGARGSGALVLVCHSGSPSPSAGSLLVELAESIERERALFAAAVSGRVAILEAAATVASAAFTTVVGTNLDGALQHLFRRGGIVIFDQELKCLRADGAVPSRIYDYFKAAKMSVLNDAGDVQLSSAARNALRGDASRLQLYENGRSYEGRAQALRDADGRVAGGALIVYDVTESQVLDGRLRAAHARILAGKSISL